MPDQNNPLLGQGQPGQFTNTGDLATLIVNKRQFSVYIIENNELDTLTDGYTSVSLPFFGIAIGAAISLGPAFVALPKGDWLRPWFGVGFLTALLLCFYFGRCSYKERKKCDKRAAKIRETEVKTEIRLVMAETITPAKPQDVKDEKQVLT
jgi:hypothetical protein